LRAWHPHAGVRNGEARRDRHDPHLGAEPGEGLLNGRQAR
jgi:hypothetical protein